MTREEKQELADKVKKYGLNDLRKLAPIGDLGYMNGWDPPFFGDHDIYLDSELPTSIMQAFREQKSVFGFEVEQHDEGWARTDHQYYCKELGLRWAVDSSG